MKHPVTTHQPGNLPVSVDSPAVTLDITATVRDTAHAGPGRSRTCGESGCATKVPTVTDAQPTQPSTVSPDAPAGEPSDAAAEHHYHLPRFRTILLVVLGGLAVIWAAPAFITFVSGIDVADIDHLYAAIFTFVVFDAVIPVFPSESLLTTASNLAAQEGSDIVLGWLILAGALGAIVGDSLLYWLSRTVLRNTFERRVEQAQKNDKVRRAMDILDRTAPSMIVFGRFVPGLRFAIGATMGITRYPYRRFLLWDAIGGTIWAAFTCITCYLIASVIEDRPFVSIAVSVVVTTALLALMYRPLARAWQETAPPTTTPIS